MSDSHDTRRGSASVVNRQKTSKSVGMLGDTADYICDGSADNVEIQAAINAVRDIPGGQVFIKRGTYSLSAAIKFPSNITIQGEDKYNTVFKMEAGKSISVINNADKDTGITTNAVLKNFTVDQQGANQTAGGGISVTGMQNCTLEDIIIKKSYVFNFLATHQANSASSKTGTVVITNGSEVVTGTNTLFASELSVGDIIKTAAGKFGRVQSVTSNTQLILYRPWGHTTESGIAIKVIQPNSGNVFRRVEFQGTVNNADASGYGFCDYSIVENCVAYGADTGGCGFVPDHAKGMQFINCQSYGHDNSGISLETSEDCTIVGGKYYDNAANGVQFISGSYKNVVVGAHCFNNVNGFKSTYNASTFPPADDNRFVDCVAYDNSGYGFRADGVNNIDFSLCTAFNNDTGGFLQNTALSRIPTDIHYVHCRAYDNRTTKAQARGIWIVTGTDTVIDSCVAKTVDHTTAGITNTGTDTIVRNALSYNPDRSYAVGSITGATTFTRVNGELQTATLTGNITATLTSGSFRGDMLTLILTQDATGSRTVTWPSNFKKAGGTLTLSTSANAVDTITMKWDGTNWREVARSLNLS